MKKRWILKKNADDEIVNNLADELNISKNLSSLLINRGITTYKEAKDFFRPSLSGLHNPFLYKDMDKCINRIESAIKNNEKILIYGDYDVDGTTAVALVYSFLKKFYKNVDYYIPDRYDEGYGISKKSIDFAADNNFSLVIALDCGIKGNEKIDYANTKNIDFIIGDHHRPGDELPKAYAIIDAKRKDCIYPYDELSGCGVGFKIVQAYAQKNNIPFEKITKYLDLVALSIASDIVQITGENRILAYYGLKQINKNPRPGFEAILKYSNIKKNNFNSFNTETIFNKQLSISDLVFFIGPRINAAGRIENGAESVKLMIAEDIDSANKIASNINNCNDHRKDLDTNTTLQALEIIRKEDEQNNKKRTSTIVYNPDWHKGVIGIVASRLTEYYYCPTIVLSKSNGMITGSARSVKNFDIYNAIESCKEFLSNFGGHKYAAGLILDPKNLEAFKKRFQEVVDSTIEEKMLIPEIEIDRIINLNEINSKFFKILKQFAPFGPGNMIPIFQTNNVIDTGQCRIVGKNHLKLNVIHPDISGYPVSAIAFKQADKFDYISQGKPFDITYHLEENNWNGNISIQLNIKDIKIHQ
ncbi:MAG: single-stranded-DNA-specific exonuclease RecJ [Bacteroidales bacterium]|nr:single-stranded-DNA-specific exonuclease RecJ [Bacteroidales bacterium]